MGKCYRNKRGNGWWRVGMPDDSASWRSSIMYRCRLRSPRRDLYGDWMVYTTSTKYHDYNSTEAAQVALDAMAKRLGWEEVK